jgi:hypothetical protein
MKVQKSLTVCLWLSIFGWLVAWFMSSNLRIAAEKSALENRPDAFASGHIDRLTGVDSIPPH